MTAAYMQAAERLAHEVRGLHAVSERVRSEAHEDRCDRCHESWPCEAIRDVAVVLAAGHDAATSAPYLDEGKPRA